MKALPFVVIIQKRERGAGNMFVENWRDGSWKR
jgi:hypothetical protein